MTLYAQLKDRAQGASDTPPFKVDIHSDITAIMAGRIWENSLAETSYMTKDLDFFVLWQGKFVPVNICAPQILENTSETSGIHLS